MKLHKLSIPNLFMRVNNNMYIHFFFFLLLEHRPAEAPDINYISILENSPLGVFPIILFQSLLLTAVGYNLIY